MKLSHLTKSFFIGTIAASVLVLPLTLSASAQSPGSTTTPDTTTSVDNDDDGPDLGWLGLLGLIGLAGLRRKPENRVEYRDPNVDPRTTTRSDYR